jgi:hypothetical protein
VVNEVSNRHGAGIEGWLLSCKSACMAYSRPVVSEKAMTALMLEMINAETCIVEL